MTVGADDDRFERLHRMILDLLQELEQEYNRSRQDAMRDPLTGLPNRRAFEPRVEQEVGRARRYGRRLTLIMVDIDHFKTYNDMHGHRSGDELLRKIGRLIQRELREPDIAFRIGGEEFVILLPETDVEGAVSVIRRLQDRIRRDEGVQITLSFGVAEFPTHGQDAEPLLEAADRALYQAKEAGRDAVRLPDGTVPVDAWGEPATTGGPLRPYRERPQGRSRQAESPQEGARRGGSRQGGPGGGGSHRAARPGSAPAGDGDARGDTHRDDAPGSGAGTGAGEHLAPAAVDAGRAVPQPAPVQPRTNGVGAREMGPAEPPVAVPVEVGFHVDDERPASIWLNGRILRVHEAVAARSGHDRDPSLPIFHVRTDSGDYRLLCRNGRWYLEGRV
ncbi:MAG TPA: diguanylate cyclase [Bacillota bacterium]